MSEINYPLIMPDLARMYWGQENPKLTKQNELWWGDSGSRRVLIKEGTWADYRSKEHGGVIKFLELYYGVQKRDAAQWLRDKGFDVPDDRPQRQQPAKGKAGKPKMKIVATFDYENEKGRKLFEVVRMESDELDPKTGKKIKSFGQRYQSPGHPAAKNDGWVWSLKDVRRVLFRLPQTLAAIEAGKRINFFEGEKAVMTAVDKLGLEATCNPMGAGKWDESYTESLRGADLLIVPDLDIEGLNHADIVASAAVAVAKRVRILKIPGLDTKEDIYEWVHKYGGTAEAFEALVEEHAHTWMPKPPASAFGAITMASLDDPGPEHEWLINGILTKRGTAFMAGPSGSGKSFAATDIAMCVARGIRYQDRRVEQGVVLYQAGEGGLGLKKRMRAYRDDKFGPNEDPNRVPFVLLPGRFNLHDSDDAIKAFISEGLAWRAHYQMRVGLVVIDTWATATTGANENDSSEVGKILARAQNIAEALDTVVLIVHHMNKNGSAIRGSTAIGANVDNTLLVEQLEITDSNSRIIRKVTVSKNKDGDGGINWQFVLRQVEVGFDQEGIAITSCVVDAPASGQLITTGGLRLNQSEMVVYDAITRALEDYGEDPRMSPMIPKAIKKVVRYKFVQELLERTWPFTPDSKLTPEEQAEQRRKAVRTTMERVGTRLVNSRVIDIDYKAQLIWLTGAPIIGRTARKINASARVEATVNNLEAQRQGAAKNLPPDAEDFGWS